MWLLTGIDECEQIVFV